MFTKEHNLEERSNNALSNKDLKKVKTEILKQLPLFRQEDVEEIFSGSGKKISVVKLVTRTLIYKIDGEPRFFDFEGRNRLYPTLFTMWRYPHCLRSLLIYGPVASRIIRGADLFAPGLQSIDGLETLEKNERVAIRIAGNPLPFAVGEASMCWEALAINHFKGTAAVVHHYYTDLMVGAVPSTCLDYAAIDAQETDPPNESTGRSNDDVQLGSDIQGDLENPTDINASSEPTPVLPFDSNEQSEQLDMYQIAVRALALTFRYLIKDDELPILVSTLWNMVQRCARVDQASSSSFEALDLKKTPYKKVSDFLRHLADQQALEISLDAAGAPNRVEAVDRSHRLLRHKAPDAAVFKQQYNALYDTTITESATSAMAHLSVSSSAGKIAPGQKIRVVELLKIPVNLRDILLHDMSLASEAGINFEYGEHLVTASEARTLLLKYFDSRSLNDPVDHSAVNVPPEDRLYSYAVKIAGSAATKDSKATKKKDTGGTKMSKKDGGVSGGAVGRDLSTGLPDLPETNADLESEYFDDDSPNDYFSSSSDQRIMVAGVLLGSAANTTGSQASSGNGSGHRYISSRSDDILKEMKESKQPLKAVTLPSSKPASKLVSDKTGAYATKSIANVSMKEAKAHPAIDAAFEPSAAGLFDERCNLAVANTQTLSNWTDGESHHTNSVAATQREPVTISKRELLTKMMGYLTSYHAIVLRDGTFVARFGNASGVTIIDRRFGKHHSTVVQGLDKFGLHLDEVVNDLKKGFSCGGAVTAQPGTEKLNEVSMNIKHAHVQFKEFLTKKYGIPDNCIMLN